MVCNNSNNGDSIMSAVNNEGPNVEVSDDDILKQRYVFYRKPVVI